MEALCSPGATRGWGADWESFSCEQIAIATLLAIELSAKRCRIGRWIPPQSAIHEADIWQRAGVFSDSAGEPRRAKPQGAVEDDRLDAREGRSRRPGVTEGLAVPG